jgi:hypothetical protein
LSNAGKGSNNKSQRTQKRTNDKSQRTRKDYILITQPPIKPQEKFSLALKSSPSVKKSNLSMKKSNPSVKKSRFVKEKYFFSH